MNNKGVIEEYIKQRKVYKMLAEKSAQIVNDVLDSKGVNYHGITYRAKTVESFSKKSEKPKYTDPLTQLTDLAGIRIVGYVEDDVSTIVEIIKDIFEVDATNSLDKSDELGVDKVGYKSVHFVCFLPESRVILPEYSKFKGLRFEVQIRTILQHAWAEIEHDKNYKFAGELPLDIQRRFRLIAGSLEMADREFNLISKEIDNYSADVKESTEKGEDLNISLNSTSLHHYMQTKFKSLVDSGYMEPTFNSRDTQILSELRNFGLKDLKDLDSLITEDLMEALAQRDDDTEPNNWIGTLRDILIISDTDKYINQSYKNSWKNSDQPGWENWLISMGVPSEKIQFFVR